MKARTTAALGVIGGGLLLPAAAAAHGIGQDAVGRSTLEFVPLGYEHMLLGWDHLLFIFGVVLLAGQAGRAAKLITLFAVGHSLTLIVATLAGAKLDATLVDVVIALSVVYVGMLIWRGRPERWPAVFAAVFAFGLVHGLGLSTRLQDLGLEREGLLGKVLAFNVGVEIGQLTAIGVIVLLGRLVATRLSSPAQAARMISTGLIAIGLVAAAVLSVPSGDSTARTQARAATQTATRGPCVERTSDPPAFAGGRHPAKLFFAGSLRWHDPDQVRRVSARCALSARTGSPVVYVYETINNRVARG